MGSFTTRATTDTEFKQIIKMLRNGYTDKNGTPHYPNNQIADILVLEANLGCRLGDIVSLRKDSFVCDNGIWKIDIVEEKTKKKRTYIVPKKVKEFIDKIDYGTNGNLFSIKKHAVWKQIRNVTAELELDNVSSHSLRKMCACNLYERTGHDIEAVCSFLQHSDTKITRTYIRRSDAKLEAAISSNVSLA